MDTYVPNVEIKEYRSEYRDKVRDIVVINLKKYYPKIEKWLEGELDKLDKGEDFCWMVINGGNNVVGVAITGLEKGGDSIAKLKTFYLSKEFCGYAISVPLLKKVLNYWIDRKIRNIFVSFAEEELEELRGFFDKFGFLMDGITPQFYRLGKTEYYMSKTFVYDEINENKFENFVREYLLKMRGLIPSSEGSEFLAHEDSKLSKTPRNVFVKIVKDKEIDSKWLFEYTQKKIEESKSIYGIVISYYPLLEATDNEKIKVIDGYLLENIFFPLKLRRDDQAGLIMPIYQYYAEGLLQMNEPQRKIAKKRLTLTHERAYFTGKDSFGGVSRGGIFFFYLTGGREHGGIIGEAKIKILDVKLNVSDAIKKYAHRGVILTEKELKKHAKNGKEVSIFLLTHVKKYPKRVSLNEIRDILSNVDCSCQPLNDNQTDKIRELSGDNSSHY
jgi:hypothetical protein